MIHVPTRVASIVGRWACAGDDDLPAVHALQDAAELEPVDADAVAVGLPSDRPDVPDDLVFLEKLRVWSQAFPPRRASTFRCRISRRHRDHPTAEPRRTPMADSASSPT